MALRFHNIKDLGQVNPRLAAQVSDKFCKVIFTAGNLKACARLIASIKVFSTEDKYKFYCEDR